MNSILLRGNMAISGIYKIVCNFTGKLYIGSSVDIETRWRLHKSRLRNNIHHNIYLQRSWNKYGESNFKFEIIEIISRELLAGAELKWFKITNCCHKRFGFNIHKDPTNQLFGCKCNNFKSKKKYKFKIESVKIPKIKMISFKNIIKDIRENFLYNAKKGARILTNQEIISLYTNEKRSCKDISVMDGRSESYIYKILIDNNIELRNKSEANKLAPDDKLIKLYNLGLSFSQIGILLGIDSSTIAKRFKTLNYPSRSSVLAKSIKYTDKEFRKFFMNHNFIELIRGS